MRSTYDRSGGNEGADASHFIRQEADGLFTTLDVAGSGVLSFVRTNHWHGSPWHYVVDGTDTVVAESSTAAPNAPVTGSTFLPAAAFPPPLALTWSTTEGADLSWVPIGFSRTLRLGYERTHYGTGYYIYELVAPGAPVQSIPGTWRAVDQPPADVLALVGQAGADIAPTGAGVTTATGSVDLPATAGTVVPVWSAAAGPAAVRALHFDVPAAAAEAFGRASIRITWDDRARPSVDAPVALFFGAGTLYNRDGREFLVRAFPVSVRFANGTASLASYFPMPFQRAARIELVSSGEAVAGVAWQVRTAAWDLPANQVGYFHATFHDHGTPVAGQDLVLLDTATDEGGGDWCGNFVGTSFTFSDQANLGTLEGDPRFFFDDSQTPQAQGTGTEEWGGGGDYWGRRDDDAAVRRAPDGRALAVADAAPEDGIESAYRFLLERSVPVRPERAHPARARRRGRLDRALPLGRALVRPARRLPGPDRQLPRRRSDRRGGARLPGPPRSRPSRRSPAATNGASTRWPAGSSTPRPPTSGGSTAGRRSSRCRSIPRTSASSCVASSTTAVPTNAPRSGSPMTPGRRSPTPGPGTSPARTAASTRTPRASSTPPIPSSRRPTDASATTNS